MKLQKRELRKRKQLIHLATEEIILESLNGNVSLSPKANERVGNLIKLIQEMETLDPRSAAQEHKHHLLTQINRQLARYQWSPQMEIRSKDWGLKPAYLYHTKTLEERHENFCIWWITELVQQRNILRLRHCRQCGHWFWAIRDHQKHCGENCRKKYASRNDRFKEKRRLYMIRYRKDERERDERTRRIARRAQ